MFSLEMCAASGRSSPVTCHLYPSVRISASGRKEACSKPRACNFCSHWPSFALGAFLLAAAATVHAATSASHAPYWLFLLALVLWPIITALPAFLVALVAGAVLARLPRRA